MLGLLDLAERDRFEAHLAGCPSCGADVVAMAVVAGLMRHTHFDDRGTGSAPAAVETPDGETPNGDGAAPPHGVFRGRRRLTLLVAAVLAAAAGAVTAVDLSTTHPSRPDLGAPVQSVTATDAATGVGATATLTPEPTGTLLQLRVHNLPPGLTCRLVVTTRAGPPQTAADWSSGYVADVTLQGASSAAPYDITGMDILTAQGRLLLSLPGSP